ncbi:MAG: SusC/RagA family TonB-linked outer membrane protein [Cytophagales bacterium]|nr:SusC/RagA family TonB-linked outer membrane protein [Cytophagales bacterium]
MKKTLTKTIIMTFRGLVYGVAVQVFFLSLLLAKGSEAQMIESVRDVKISLDLENASLKECFHEIEKKTNYKFSYDHFLIESNVKISFTSRKKPVSEVLMEISKKADLKFRQINNNINVQKIDAENDTGASVVEVTIQGIAITGKVTASEDNEGLPGVNVIVKGTSQGTVTDVEGNYSLEVPDENSILVFSSVGYVLEEVLVGTQTVINFAMSLDITALEEIVVVGYGTQKKAHVTGAATSVEMEEVLANRPITNPILALQGAVPGLQITTSSGQPGDRGLDINIRGTTSINGGGPLILMDNVPVTAEDINPQDVESVSVLKDAAASSIYGARAAFGVILITTKSGSKGQPIKFNYSNTFSFHEPEDIPRKATTYEFITALDSWGTNPFWTGQDIPTWLGFLDEYRADPSTYPEGYAMHDGLRYPLTETNLIGEWLDDPGFTQIHNFNFNGGSDRVTYRVSAGYSNEDGIIITRNDSYVKYNINSSLNVDLTPKLKSTTNVLYINSNRKRPLGSYSNAITFNTYTPASGNHVFDDGTEVPYDTPANREQLKEPTRNYQDNIRFFQKLDYNIIQGLNIAGEYTFEKRNLDQVSSDNQILTVNPERFVLNAVNPVNTFYRKSNQKITYNAFNLYIKYQKSFNQHNFGIMAGLNRENSASESFWVRQTNLINVDLPSLATATGTLTANESFYEWAVMGYFGRLNYNFREKYFLEANGRYDGSSRFKEGDRFGFFPSVSAGWRIGREAFMEPLSVVSDLKLRASWGEVGNQIVKDGNNQNYYPAIPGMSSYNASWLNENAGIPYVTLGMPELISTGFTWETIETLNFGLDLELFESKLSTSFDVFRRNTKGMIIPGAELPAVLGADAPTENAADLRVKGWELEMSWNDRIGDFSYNLGFTLSDNYGEITKFDNPAGLLSQHYVGKRMGEIWGYTTDGYYVTDDFEEGTLDDNLMNGTLKEGIPAWEGRNQNPGDIKYVDRNGDGIINDGNNTLEDPGDRTIIGNNTRRYQYGLFGNASWKNFDLSFLLNGIGKRDIYQNNNVRFPYRTEFEVVYSSQLDYWTPENTDAYFPRNYPLGAVNYGINRQTQTKYMLNGAYMRIKNITLGYMLPQNFSEKIRIQALRVFVAGENILDFNDYPEGINTELSNKANGATYPYMKSYSVGLNLTF